MNDVTELRVFFTFVRFLDLSGSSYRSQFMTHSVRRVQARTGTTYVSGEEP